MIAAKIKKKVYHHFMVSALIVFILFNLFLAVYAIQINNPYAIKGQISFIIYGFLLFLLRQKLNMSKLTYFILLLGFSFHVSNILGDFYYHSPIIIPWDYVTHIVPFIGFSMLLFNFQKERMDHHKIFCFRNIFLFLFFFLAVSGIGVLIEIGEYAGYALLGVKNGALLFGGGDFDTIVVTSDVVTEMNRRGGGWYDAMTDLLVNSYTAFVTLLVLFWHHFYEYRKRKKRKRATIT
ncbi:MAG: hypothetical protein Q8R37_00025 [Nanoarchaeota archaeon]|nr:hypothetical protein [Nanoarchaeota archaeon]